MAVVDYARFGVGAQWMQAAMAGETERVPVYAQLHEFAAAQLQIPGKVFYTRPESWCRRCCKSKPSTA